MTKEIELFCSDKKYEKKRFEIGKKIIDLLADSDLPIREQILLIVNVLKSYEDATGIKFAGEIGILNDGK